MVDLVRRLGAYSEKIGPTAARERQGDGRSLQGNAVAAGKSFQLERGVKAALESYAGVVPSTLFGGYLAFARRAGKILDKYGVLTAKLEIFALEDQSVSRGLSRAVCRYVLLRVFGYSIATPPSPEGGPIVWFFWD